VPVARHHSSAIASAPRGQAPWMSVVVTRLRIDDRTKNYLTRRTAEGKTKKEIIRCLKRYVAREIYRVLIKTAQSRGTAIPTRKPADPPVDKASVSRAGEIMPTVGEGPFVNVNRPADGGPYACPCCGYLTLDGRGSHEICPVCFWNDDGQDDHDADEVRGAPNGALSLTQARRNFAQFGASSERRLAHVRAPRDEEHPSR
jgi:hypothetical protein